MDAAALMSGAGGMSGPDPVAVYGEHVTLYWHGIVLSAAIMIALLIFRALLGQEGGREGGRAVFAYSVLFGAPLGILGARALYCIFTPDAGGLFRLSSGGYALYGGVAGAALGLFIASRLTGSSYAGLLDAAAPAAAAAIAAGRLAAFFSHEELGYIIENEKWQFFPFSIYVGSEGCWRLCVFVFETLAAVIALVICAWLFDRLYGDGPTGRRTVCVRGDVFIMLSIIYCTSQILLESWRTDTMTMRNNAFVRISQVLSAVFMAAALAVVFVRACRAKKKKAAAKDIALWAVTAGLFTVAFIMEFGKNKETMLRNNWVMFFTLFPISVIGAAALLGAFRFEQPEPRREPAGRTGYGAGGVGRDVSAGRMADGEPVFDDDDEW